MYGGEPSLPLDTAVFCRLTVEWRVSPSGVCYVCAPSLVLDAAVSSRFDDDVTAVFSLDGSAEGMTFRALVR